MMIKKILSNIYKKVPFKKNLFSLLKQVWIPPQNVYQHLHFKDDFTVKIDEKHSFKMQHFGYELENELFWRGVKGWEAVSFDLWVKLCEKSEVIFDVGANTGVFALIARTLNPTADIYAFEPVERVCQKIHINNQLNNYDIKVIQKAAADYDGVGEIYDAMGEHVYSVTVNDNKFTPEDNIKPTTISTIRLATFLEQEGLEKVDLLKIDVESFEPEVLDGLGSYLKKFHPSIIIEILDDEIGRRVHEITKDLDYLYFKIEGNSKLVRTKELRNKIVNNADDHNYFFCTEKVAKELKLI